MNEVAWPGALAPSFVKRVLSNPATTYLVYRGMLTQPGWRQLYVRLVPALRPPPSREGRSMNPGFLVLRSRAVPGYHHEGSRLEDPADVRRV